MNAQSGYLNDLPPEIFPVIASLLPLHATPSTLLSLALVNHHVSDIVLPLVYSRFILKNEYHAVKALQRLLDEPELGKAVREIHILSNMALGAENEENPFDVVREIEKVIAAGSLPYIHTLGLHLLSRWGYDVEYRANEGFRHLHSGFWKTVRKNCPRLRGLVLHGIAESKENPWLDNSGLLEIQDITSLTLSFKEWMFTRAGGEKVLKNVQSLSSSLHTLDLAPDTFDPVSASPLFSLCLPYLRSLSLACFEVENVADAMTFWKCHPNLQYLKIFTRDLESPWFTNELPNEFLPNLRHLKANFNDVRTIAPILRQLVSLTIFHSFNAQVPYLIRVVLPEGLPNLKSLNIGQRPSAKKRNRRREGSLWYETEDREFMDFKPRKRSRNVLDGYMHSIVRGAPNLEEIGFFSSQIATSDWARIAPELGGLSKLKRFYYLGDFMAEKRDIPVFHLKALAEACGQLTTVVDTSSLDPPYFTAKLFKDEEGKLIRVEVGTGYGMHYGNEDEASPRR